MSALCYIVTLYYILRMRWLLCPDSFKDSASAVEIAEALASGMRMADAGVSVDLLPLSDGGEGFVDMVGRCFAGTRRYVEVEDALRRPLRASYFLSASLRTAWVGVSEASGIQELSAAERDGRITSSYGTGLLLADAIRCGVDTVYIGLGGSAVNDGGCGMAAALGCRFADPDGRVFVPVAETLRRIARIEPGGLLAGPLPRFVALTDVDNPLTGPQGASYCFGPQKGIPAAALAAVDAGLTHLAAVWRRDLGRDVTGSPGAGAAGGMGGGCLAFLGAEMRSGTRQAIGWTGLESAVMRADAVVTGEGKLDETSLRGKLVSGVMQLAQRAERPLYLVCGVNKHPDFSRQRPPRAVIAIRDFHENDSEAMAATLRTCRQIGAALINGAYG